MAIILASLPFVNAFLAFAQGLSNRYWHLFLFPVQIIPLLLTVVLFGATLFKITRAIFCRDHRRLSVLGLGIAPVVSFVAFLSLPPPDFWFLQGFRCGVLQRVSLSEIQEIATIAARIVPDGSLILPLVGTGRGEPDNSARWNAFRSQAPIGNLSGKFVVYHRDGTVQLEWGGALTGHWGLRVGQPAARLERDSNFIPISEEIAAYFTD
jgi:hypothetical protein